MNRLRGFLFLFVLISIFSLGLIACDSGSGDDVARTGDGDFGLDDDDDTVDDDDDDDDGDDDDDNDTPAPIYTEVEAEGRIRAMVPHLTTGVIFAADYKNSEILVLDSESGALTMRLPIGAKPVDIDINPAGTRLWIATQGAGSVSYINIESGAEGSVAIAGNSVGVAVGGNGKVYVIDDAGNVAIVDEAMRMLITEVDGALASVPSPAFIEIDQEADLAYIANSGVTPSVLVRVDISTDDFTIVEQSANGTVGGFGKSLSLSDDGTTIVYPCGAGNGLGYTVYDMNTGDFTNVFGEFNIGTKPHFMEYDPQSEFMAGINGDTNDQRLYIMDPTTFGALNVIDMTSWFNNAYLQRAEQPMLLQANYDGSTFVVYAESTTEDLDGHFYLIPRADLLPEEAELLALP